LNILAIDTSGQAAGAAISNGSRILGEITANAYKKLTHSENLLPMLDALFRFTGLKLDDMTHIACICGPGSFTGLRIGAATALGLAKAAGKPLIPVPTLNALAYNIGYAVAIGDFVVPMLDARRGQVYAALYRGNDNYPDQTTALAAVSIEEILTALNQFRPMKRVFFIGDGAYAYRDKIYDICLDTPFKTVFVSWQDNRAAGAAICAAQMIDAGASFKPEDFSLLYARKPQAERARLGDTQ
jgi:tRNA threonylcarbamoyladenosine biosynthesis protein TsaB